VEEDHPPVPGEVERALELLHVLEDAEAALRVRVLEGIVGGGDRNAMIDRASFR
jgi:hypothetical protein